MAIENEKNSKALAILVLNSIYLRDFLHIDLVQIKKFMTRNVKYILKGTNYILINFH
jgi:hypothetical protein